MKFGCSTRVFVTVLIVVIALLAVSLIFGGLGASFTNSKPFVEPPTPAIAAEAIGHVGPLAITNTMVTAWMSIILLVVLFVVGTRKMKLVPRGLQNLLESAVEYLLNLVEGVVGRERGRKFFPFIATIFLFVFVNAWMGLIPGYGSITVKAVVHGEEEMVPLLRAANTDLNLTLALAVFSFVFVEYMGFAYHGLGYAKKFVNIGPMFRGFRTLFSGKIGPGLSGIFMGAIEGFVGIIETVSEWVRLVSFSFRLFGNMLAGEILLLIMFFLAPFVIPDLFYLLETLVGVIQAMIFAVLTLAFASMATAEHEH
ncbi:MAG: F0F1 ATP synthase subunit A [Chloroflexi bacterium]|nr:F0F1 ATP synthase subunit A [Chloroflexota bacterium]